MADQTNHTFSRLLPQLPRGIIHHMSTSSRWIDHDLSANLCDGKTEKAVWVSGQQTVRKFTREGGSGENAADDRGRMVSHWARISRRHAPSDPSESIIANPKTDLILTVTMVLSTQCHRILIWCNHIRSQPWWNPLWSVLWYNIGSSKINIWNSTIRIKVSRSYPLRGSSE